MEIEILSDNRCPSHSGILLDICKGKKWVYQEGTSVIAVTYSYCVGGCGIFGEIVSGEKTKQFLYEVFSDLRKYKIDEFEFSCEKDELAKKILSLFPEKNVSMEMEYSYRYEGRSTPDRAKRSTDKYVILQVNRELFLALPDMKIILRLILRLIAPIEEGELLRI